MKPGRWAANGEVDNSWVTHWVAGVRAVQEEEEICLPSATPADGLAHEETTGEGSWDRMAYEDVQEKGREGEEERALKEEARVLLEEVAE